MKIADLDSMKMLLEQTVKDPSLAPKPSGTTYCNIAVRRISQQMGCDVFPLGMLANDMWTLMHNSSAFVAVDTQQAGIRANNVQLVIAAKQFAGHGHVAVVYPSPEMYYSASWKKEVPFLANVGKDNGILPASKVFPVAQGEPDYFLYEPATAA